MARHGAGDHLGGALGNRRHIGNLTASVGPARPRPARLASLTQRRQQFTPQFATGQHIQAHIDGLAEVVSPYLRIRASEPPAICSGEQPSASCIWTYCHSQGSRSFVIAAADRLEPSPGLRRAGPIGAAPAWSCEPTRG